MGLRAAWNQAGENAVRRRVGPPAQQVWDAGGRAFVLRMGESSAEDTWAVDEVMSIGWILADTALTYISAVGGELLSQYTFIRPSSEECSPRG